MAQKTDLNISPYYDDFDGSKNFYKVLFKPGFPVQSRELTTLQSILQNQIENFGGHIFKEGSVVVPGGISYDDQFNSVKLNDSQFGTDISLYINDFVGQTITGQTSGVTATIQKVVLSGESDEVDYTTIYVKYLNSDNNFESSKFIDGEELSAGENVIYGNTTITSGSSFATAITDNATSKGSAVSVDSGIYFIRGYFVAVEKETLILDYYENKPTYRVGLKISESLVNSKQDDSLYDNAKGFSNFAAPGADRLKIDLSLTKKSIDDTNDTNFVELLRVKEGKVNVIDPKTEYNKIRDYFAERTFDESGNYTVKNFDFILEESLNDRIGNDGVFLDTEKTVQGNTPSENLMCLKISPGKAYVQGYDVEKSDSTILDVEKPRTTQSTENIRVSSNFGILFRINNVTGTPKVRETVELYSQLGAVGDQIGETRLYSFNLTDSPYSGVETNWDFRVYDTQTYTRITLNKDVDSNLIKESFYIQGRSSGASGYATADGSGSNVIFLRQTSGTFAKGEGLTINGVNEPRKIVDIKVYDISDVKSFKQTEPFGSGNSDFTADSLLEKISLPNGITQVELTAASGGVSTVTSPGNTFSGITTDTIIRYQRVGQLSEIFNRVSFVSPDLEYFEIKEITTVPNIFEGSLPINPVQTNATVGIPYIRGNGRLFIPLPEEDVSSVDLSNSSLRLYEQLENQNVDVNGEITINTTALSGLSDITFVEFDQERYGIGYSGGTFGTTNEDTFSLGLGSNSVTFKGLDDTLSDTDTVVNLTVEKSNIQSKLKNHVRSSTLIVNGSRKEQSGSTADLSINDGLTFNQYYGLRVQDDEISLNKPDVHNVIAVYESLNTSDPSLDLIEFSVTANVNSNAIIGELLVGQDSHAIARVVTNNSTTDIASGDNNKLGIVYFSEEKFSVGETVVFKESNITTTINSITLGNYKNVTESFLLDEGQKSQYYDYSRIVKRNGNVTSSRKLLIVFDHYTVSENETGDLFTVSSYDADRYTTDIPTVENIRLTDVLDFRPRVSDFDPSVTTDRSPFDFISRTSAFNNLPTRIVSPNEGLVVGCDFYLPRIDKIYLDSFGKFIYDKGIPSQFPAEPKDRSDEFMKLATVTMPPYLYDVDDASFNFEENKRYTMRDIGSIEDRVERLEETTTLSILELSTQSLQIRDFEGNDRFKTGFFADDFNDASRLDDLSEVSIDSGSLTSELNSNTIELQLALSTETSPETEDIDDDDVELLDKNIQKTGDALTLAYKEVGWLEQPFATTSVNVNPFNVVVYEGVVQLTPEIDTWIRKKVNTTTVNQTRTIWR